MQDDHGSIQSKVDDLEAEFDVIQDDREWERNRKPAEDALCKEASAASVQDPPGRNPNSRLLQIKLNTLLALPFIYGMAVPLVLLDLAVTSYQAICFRLFNIQRVRKADYIALERHDLGYLNFLERINCDYCGYANGLIAFTREILARTEQYFCPIKHAHKVLGVHDRYSRFLNYGETQAYEKKVESLRTALAPATRNPPPEPRAIA